MLLRYSFSNLNNTALCLSSAHNSFVAERRRLWCVCEFSRESGNSIGAIVFASGPKDNSWPVLFWPLGDIWGKSRISKTFGRGDESELSSATHLVDNSDSPTKRTANQSRPAVPPPTHRLQVVVY